jgi:hypothetical protein
MVGMRQEVQTPMQCQNELTLIDISQMDLRDERLFKRVMSLCLSTLPDGMINYQVTSALENSIRSGIVRCAFISRKEVLDHVGFIAFKETYDSIYIQALVMFVEFNDDMFDSLMRIAKEECALLNKKFIEFDTSIKKVGFVKKIIDYARTNKKKLITITKYLLEL